VALTSNAPDRAASIDKLLGEARCFAVEPLAVERRGNAGKAGTQRIQRFAVLARHRQRERIIPLGPAVGETNLHSKQSLEKQRCRDL